MSWLVDGWVGGWVGRLVLDFQNENLVARRVSDVPGKTCFGGGVLLGLVLVWFDWMVGWLVGSLPGCFIW